MGGKTGVNLQYGKNLVGCFYPPQGVMVDIEPLRMLPQRELRAGIYESIKAGLIRDAALFRLIESDREAIDQGDPASLEKMVAASIRIKADVVSEDERELGVRMILTFGYTLGHAIEAASGIVRFSMASDRLGGYGGAPYQPPPNRVTVARWRSYRGSHSLTSAPPLPTVSPPNACCRQPPATKRTGPACAASFCCKASAMPSSPKM